MNHCPSSSACVFPEWTEDQCRSEVHNWLGFAYRSESAYAGERPKYEEKGSADAKADRPLGCEKLLSEWLIRL